MSDQPLEMEPACYRCSAQSPLYVLVLAKYQDDQLGRVAVYCQGCASTLDPLLVKYSHPTETFGETDLIKLYTDGYTRSRPESVVGLELFVSDDTMADYLIAKIRYLMALTGVPEKRIP